MTNNIPYSLALRIVRICTDMSERDMRLEELKNMLLSRNYKKSIINAAIEKVFLDPKQLKKSFKNRIQIVLYLLFSMTLASPPSQMFYINITVQ